VKRKSVGFFHLSLSLSLSVPTTSQAVHAFIDQLHSPQQHVAAAGHKYNTKIFNKQLDVLPQCGINAAVINGHNHHTQVSALPEPHACRGSLVSTGTTSTEVPAQQSSKTQDYVSQRYCHSIHALVYQVQSQPST
jgi:hypothetical protein